MNKLVVGIRFPMGRLAATGNDDTWPIAGLASLPLDGRSQVHQQTHRCEYALRMVYEPDELPEVGLAAEVDHVPEKGMVMATFADLDEADSPAKMVDYFLVSPRIPPFNREVIFASSDYDPEWGVVASDVFDLRRAALFHFG
jgi:hypothetical protein